MDIQRIGSFNVQDSKVNRNGGIRPDGSSNGLRFAYMVNYHDFDFLGTQELTINYISEIQSYLKFYKFYGSYRYGNGLLTKIPYNETNSIITNKNVVEEKTFWLPWIPKQISALKESIVKMSIMPRIATVIISEHASYGKICLINTHLDYQIPSLQKVQLEAIKKLVLKYKENYPIVLTGDFNMQLAEEHFKGFVSTMRENNVDRVAIDKPTHYTKEKEAKQIDHIFVSRDFEVVQAGVIEWDSYMRTSDYYPIYADIKRR